MALAEPVADRNLSFSTTGQGQDKSIPLWGLDTAWPSEGNMRRGIAFMGAEQVDVVRVSFTPTSALVNSALQADEAALLDLRLDYADLAGPTTPVMLNADAPTIDPWFRENGAAEYAVRWAELIDVTLQRSEARGHPVLAAAPFNEPDYSIHQGTMADFYAIAGELAQNPNFANVRITGGNTLNPDVAGDWYDYLRDRLQEGNTHQLAGSFDSYAGFFSNVVSFGDRAVNDELHNVMEAIVGVEYGMQTAIWWGTAERTRGEFVKASDGRRLGYAEHRPNWTAAAVYRAPDGQVQAFGGASERQAITTTYRFVARDRDVFYDGYGPTREYTMTVPGGTGYWENQVNAEAVVNIAWGEDVQPAVAGRYILVNKNSGLVLEVADSNVDDGANIQQGYLTGEQNQLWDVTPLAPRNGGDYSYFSVTAAHSGKAIDVFNWSLDDGGDVRQWTYGNGGNQHWYLEYAGDGWFSICSRHSALCLEAADASVNSGANVQQAQANAGDEQLWRLLPLGADIEFDSPLAPSGLQATGQRESIRLDWAANTDLDLAGYTLLRSDNLNGPYEIIARGLTETSFVDHGVASGSNHYYKLRASDHSLNQSEYSSEVVAASTGQPGLVAHLALDRNTLDSTENINHAAVSSDLAYVVGQEGTASLDLNGAGEFLQLPATVANHAELSIAAWVYWNGGDAWQRIFDFGNGVAEHLYLTPATDANVMRFAIDAGAGEQGLETTALSSNQWVHVALVLDSSGATLYLDGVAATQNAAVTLTPNDIGPVSNFIGRGQSGGPTFDGRIDDFRVYNYGLGEEEVLALVSAAN